LASVGFCSTSDVITLEQNWHHLYSTSAEGKDVSNDILIRVIGSTEQEICAKMLRNLREKNWSKGSLTLLGCFVVRISGHDDAFLRIFELEASPVVGQQLQLKDKKRRKTSC